jgi:ribosomal-protein-serine acetyltransferase
VNNTLIVPPRADLRARPIETDRLTLAPVDPADSEEVWLAVNGSRPLLQKWLPWVPYYTEPASSQRFTEACVADWDHGRALRFAIRERAGRMFVGVVGLESCVHIHRQCDLGYWLRKEGMRRGIMTEAARAAVEFAFRYMGAHRIRVAAATDNHASQRVISRLGFRFEGIARQAEWCDDRWLDHGVFALLATDPRPT